MEKQRYKDIVEYWGWNIFFKDYFFGCVVENVFQKSKSRSRDQLGGYSKNMNWQ